MSKHSSKREAWHGESNIATSASSLCHTILRKLVGNNSGRCYCRDLGTASSWSLSRLDALADEVKTCFQAQHTAQPVNAPDHSVDSAPEHAALLERQASNSNAGSSTGSPQETPAMQFWQTWLAWAVGRFRGVKHRPPHLKQQPHEDNSPTLDSVVIAMQQYPMQTIAAINTVLYEQHGYNRMHLHGNPR